MHIISLWGQESYSLLVSAPLNMPLISRYYTAITYYSAVHFYIFYPPSIPMPILSSIRALFMVDRDSSAKTTGAEF